jgi:hypothetical protein
MLLDRKRAKSGERVFCREVMTPGSVRGGREERREVQWVCACCHRGSQSELAC